MNNPYALSAEEFAALPRTKFYSPDHIAWATFLGAPLAGCVLMALNYRRFGNPTAAKVAWVAGITGTALLLAIAFVIPVGVPKSVLPAVCTFGMYRCAKALQGNDYAHRLANGGVKASGWAVLGIAILCMICTIAVLFGVLLVVAEDSFPAEL